MTKNPQFIKGAIIAVIVAAAIAVLTVLAGDSLGVATGDITGKLFLVSFSFIFFGITAAISMVIAEKPEYINLGNAGMIVSAIAFFVVLLLIFTGVNTDLTFAKLAFALFIASIALAHICLLHHFNLRTRHAFNARMAATIFISIFSFIIIINIFGAGGGYQSLMGAQSMMKFGIGSLVADLAATLLVPLCNRLPAEEPVKLSFTDEPPREGQQEQAASFSESETGTS